MAAGAGGETERIPLSGLELPRVLGVLCAPGDPPALDAVRGVGAPPSGPPPMPVPVHAGGLLMRDVNGTGAHVVLRAAGVAGAGRGRAAAVWDERRRGLVLLPSVEIFALPAGDRVIRAEDRGCAVALPGGTVVYARHDAAELLVAVPGEVDGERFWPDEPGAAGAAGGRRVRARPAPAGGARRGSGRWPRPPAGMLAAAVPGGLLVFDLRSGHGPRALRWPPASSTTRARSPRRRTARSPCSTARRARCGGSTAPCWRRRIARPPADAGAFAPASGAPRAPRRGARARPERRARRRAGHHRARSSPPAAALLSVVQGATGGPSVVELGAGRSRRAGRRFPRPGLVAVRLHDVVFLDPAADDVELRSAG